MGSFFSTFKAGKMPAEKYLNVKTIIPTNPSSQALVKSHEGQLRPNDSEESIEVKKNVKSPNFVSRQDWMTLAILTFVNLINYMDRYTIAGILKEVQDYYKIEDAQAGAIQTVFVASFMVFAPVFGFLGDRYNRKAVMVVGISLWAIATLVGSYMDSFSSFMTMRALVGIGEASYTTIAPTLLSDLFVKDMRSRALAIFYFAIPVGSGLGYVIGSSLASTFGAWQAALRGTPILGGVAVLLIIAFVKDPPRGESEGHEALKATSYTEDLKSLATNKSFVFSTLGFTCVTFCTGALAWWGPKFLADALMSANVADQDRPMKPTDVAFVFGVITMVSGIIGVPLGSLASTKWRPKQPRADPLICGMGLAISSIFLCLSLFTPNVNFFLAFVLIFLGEISLNLNWSIVSDILLYVVVPTRRGSASAIQILISHLFGDAGSPYLIGLVSDSLRETTVTEDRFCTKLAAEDLNASDPEEMCDATMKFYSMQYSLIINILIVFLGAIGFFITAVFIVKDKERVERYVADASSGDLKEKEDMIKSENNSTWSSEDDNPPILVLSTVDNEKKLNPLLPLAYKKNKSHN